MMTVRRVRLLSGLGLGLFVLPHLLNHALGLVSLGAMEAVREPFSRIWRSPPGTLVLYGSLLAHLATTLVSLHRRRTLAMPLREALQVASGLALPFLLLGHVVGTRVAQEVAGREPFYRDVIHGYWSSPAAAAQQSAALVLAWGHLCVGLWFWWRSRAWFPAWRLALFAVALLVPVLAWLGFAEIGKDLVADPGFVPRAALAPEMDARIDAIRGGIGLALLSALGAVLAARGIRAIRRRSARVRISYPGGRVVAVPAGSSVLEASRIAGIPHLSVCGAKGRCSTCRVRVTHGHDGQPAPSTGERAALDRIGAPDDVRLACQLRPAADLGVTPLLSPSGTHVLAQQQGSGAAAGREREIAVLFCDLRGFTQMVEGRMPFDTVYLLNRYFEMVGAAVADAGGHLDKFIGDGALALFGLSEPLPVAAARAVDAAERIAAGIERLNAAMAAELPAPLRIAIGLHAGPAVIGRMGYGTATSLTAVGDTINTASRLESIAKELDAELVVSAHCAASAGRPFTGHERRTVDIRGREQPIEAWIVRRLS